MKKKLPGTRVLFFILFLFLFSIHDALAAPEKYRTSPDPVAVMADGVLVRPLGLVSTVVGSVFYVITLPFTLPSDSADTARQQLVEYPAWFTFQRPIGNFGHRYQRENIIEEKKALQRTIQEGREKEAQDEPGADADSTGPDSE
jgi:hypothetical protein